MGILCALNTGTLNLVLAERYDVVERCSATGLRLLIICCLAATLVVLLRLFHRPSQGEGLLAMTNKDALLDCPNPLR